MNQPAYILYEYRVILSESIWSLSWKEQSDAVLGAVRYLGRPVGRGGVVAAVRAVDGVAVA